MVETFSDTAPPSENSEEQKPTGEELDAAQPSLLEQHALLRLLKAHFRDDASHSAEWRKDAKMWFDFRAGDQWTPEEKSQLNSMQRPEIVFNRTIVLIAAIAGFEINGRHEIQFLPRNLQDTAVNEVLTGASKWMADECDGEDEESEAFQDSLTVGMGWTENRLEYEQEPNGKYIEEQVNPIEMYWDRSARKKNLSDARRVARLRKMEKSEAKQLFPGFSDTQLDARWAVGMDPEEQTKTLEQKRRREENASDNFIDRDEVHIVHMQWWEREPYWLVADPATNQKVSLTEQQYDQLSRRMSMFGVKLTAVKLFRRVYKYAFIGDEILETGNAPVPDQFIWKCITGHLHKSKGTWFGLVKIAVDPQKWGNKWLSQTLHIMNANAKGGIMAEADFFENQRQAEESWARPEAITWVAKGALSKPDSPKWQQKPVAEFPAGFFQLLEFAVSSLRDVTGINLELLGQKDVNQPGILEAQRKQAGMTVLATVFDSLRRFRKQVGRIRLYYIQNFLADGRLVRITGPDGAKVIPLLRDKALGEYDVIVDDTPTSPNQKQANWAIIAPMLPMFKDQLAADPELLLSILEYSPLPERLISMLRATLAKKQPDTDQQKQFQQQQQQLAIARIVAAISKDQSTAELQNKKAQATEATAMYDLAMARNLLTKHNIEMERAGLDAQKVAAEIDTERATADHTRAQTAGEHADTHRQHVGTLIDALTPIGPQPQQQAQQNGSGQ